MIHGLSKEILNNYYVIFKVFKNPYDSLAFETDILFAVQFDNQVRWDHQAQSIHCFTLYTVYMLIINCLFYV
jgi:hypothetical protein